MLLNRLLRSYKQNPDDLTVTSGGARLKIMTSIDGGQWIIKFPAHVDGENAGMNKEKCLDIMKGIEANVKERLGEYL